MSLKLNWTQKQRLSCKSTSCFLYVNLKEEQEESLKKKSPLENIVDIPEECKVGYGRELPLMISSCDIVLASPIPLVWGMLCGTFPWKRHQGITCALWALINIGFYCGAPLSVTGSFTDAIMWSFPSDRVLERADLHEIWERTIPYKYLRKVSRTSKGGSFSLVSPTPPPPPVLVCSELFWTSWKASPSWCILAN